MSPTPQAQTSHRRARSARDSRLIYSRAVPSTAKAVEPTVGRVLRVLQKSGCVDGQSAAVKVALREALANAIVHGNRSQARKRVAVQCFRQADAGILLVVRDQGRGFDPAQVDDPTRPENLYRATGRGIFLIRHFMDEVRFERGGREIRMSKGRKPASS